MNLGNAIEEALERLRSRTGLVLLVAFLAVGVATVVARQTLLAASLTEYLGLGGDPAMLPLSPADVRPIALALPVGYGLAVALFGAVTLVSEYASVVTLRAFTGSSLREAATRRVTRTVLVGFFVGLVVRMAVLVGLVAFVLPGLFLASALLFAHARVAVEGDGPLTALAESWTLTKGRRFAVSGVVAVLASLYLLPRLVAGAVPGEIPSLLVGGLLVGAANLVSAAVVARAYVALRDDRVADADAEDEEEADPYDAPLGADDLPEP